ncbi:MAG: hypothetical protein COA78_20565 [Blastopirellula sp.]|nr:MAG: hypothetical protein COA78_20565 [Blastopirellula sp.]
MPENTQPETNHSTASVIAKILDVVGPLIALIFVFGLFAILDQLYGSQQFLSETNIRTILIQTAVVAVAALGMTMIIVSGGIDLSAGTALALCATVLAWGLNEDVAFLITQGENFESVSEQLEKDQKPYRKLVATKEKAEAAIATAMSKIESVSEQLETAQKEHQKLADAEDKDEAAISASKLGLEEFSEQLDTLQKEHQKLVENKEKDKEKTELAISAAMLDFEPTKNRLLSMLEIKTNQVALLADSEKKNELLPILEAKKENLNDPDYIFSANIKWLKNIPNSPWSIWIALVMALITGVVTGLVNGALITSLRVVPFIVTLGTMTIYSGLGLYLANDTPILPNVAMQVPNQLSMLISNSKGALVFGLPLGLWLLIVMAIIMVLLLRYSVLSRHLFAIGSNEATARLCGINVPRTKILVYAFSGLFVGIAGIYLFSRLSSGNPNGGSGKELEIIAAVVIGGGSLSGGRGSILGTIAGALIVGVISAGSTLLGLQLSVYNIILGSVIIGAVLVDQIRQRYHETN